MRRLLLPLALLASLLAMPTHPAAAAGTTVLDATFSSPANGWAKVERYHDTDASFPQEAYPPDGRGNQEGLRLTYFNTVTQPRSNTFLVYSAPHWQTGTKATPILLVHGANDNADREWANPNETPSGCGQTSCPSTGLMQYLDTRGYKVFAIGFPHKQGDNLVQAQLVADAIGVIKAKLGVTKVDLVAWSKGGFPARAYVSSVKPSWGRVYQGDVRKLVLIGNANNGLDYAWRHGAPGAILIYPECGGSLNGPASVTSYVCYGITYSHPELSYTGTGSNNTFPGQIQMLKRWDGTFGLDTSTQDWYTVYNGGWGYTSYSPGIAAAITQGSLVDTIRTAGVPSTVASYLLCGGNPSLPYVYNENTGPSDGLVFRASCEDHTGMAGWAATTTVTGDNHLQLGWGTTESAQVVSWLG